MKRSIQLVLVLVAATLIAAAGSHWLAGWLRIHTKASDPISYGESNGKPPAFFAGSSLAGYGIDWEQIAKATDTEIKTWGIAGGSPVEFEQFQKKVPRVRATYIVVSTHDLNEANFCDFRAALVPLSDSVKTLIAAHADWSYSRRALSQYPMTWLRTLFPTLGRSRSIMGVLHEHFEGLMKPASVAAKKESQPTLEVGKEKEADDYRKQRVSDWPESQIISKRVAVRASFQGPDEFDGPKRLAFERMLQYGCQRGRTVVLVLPPSAAYAKEIMSPEMIKQFENTLTEVKQHVPDAEWLRLDQMPGLAADENYCDLVHMNVYGQKLATDAFLAWLKQTAKQP